jgi:hypothetical protein
LQSGWLWSLFSCLPNRKDRKSQWYNSMREVRNRVCKRFDRPIDTDVRAHREDEFALACISCHSHVSVRTHIETRASRGQWISQDQRGTRSAHLCTVRGRSHLRTRTRLGQSRGTAARVELPRPDGPRPRGDASGRSRGDRLRAEQRRAQHGVPLHAAC